MDQTTAQQIHEQATAALSSLLRLFAPGMRLSLIGHIPGNLTGDVVVTADRLTDLAAVIERQSIQMVALGVSGQAVAATSASVQRNLSALADQMQQTLERMGKGGNEDLDSLWLILSFLRQLAETGQTKPQDVSLTSGPRY